jgi:hypothetical protein
MRFSLQDMVRQTLAEAERREKIASEQEPASETSSEEKKKEEKKQGPPASAKTPPESSSDTPERNEESLEEKTSSVFVEKLASAVEYLNSNYLAKEAVGKPEPPRAHSPEGAAAGIGPGAGAGATPTTKDSPTPGKQSENTGQATGQQQAPTNPGSDPASPGQTNPETALETTIQDPPGGSEDWTNKDVQKQASVSRVKRIMAKMAAEGAPGNIGAKTTNPHQSSPEGVSAAGEGKPSVPGEVSKQESMVAGNEAATNYTKQQAKAVPKARMGEVLDEPAQKKSTDPVLQENLDAAGSAGVKLSSVQKAAAARALLQKIAEEGAKPDASPEEKEKAEKLQAAFQAKKEEKEKSSSGMPLGGGY